MCSMKHEAKNNNRQISPTGLNLMRETITYNIYVIYENLLFFVLKPYSALYNFYRLNHVECYYIHLLP